jgi:hypothetical protein
MVPFKRRTALSAAAVFSLIAAGAAAPLAAHADTSSADFDAQAIQTLEQNDSVQAVAKNAAGQTVVLTTDPSAPLEGPLASEDVLKRTVSVPLTAYAQDDVVGGAGYLAGMAGSSGGGLCSVGYSGWSSEGDPVVISAGHCTSDNSFDLSARTVPSGDPAGGGATDNSDVEVWDELGELLFSQYGGPGNTPGNAGDFDAIDISVIDVTNSDLNLLPEVTTWSADAVDAEDLSLSTIPVTSVGSAVAGPVAKSGRTTGYTEGEAVDLNGWALVSGRYVYGFGSFVESIEGDSGGSVIQGETAVGILSGGGEVDGQSYMWAADLQASLAQAGDYTVALHIDAPELVSPADEGTVGAGGAITGTAPAGTTLVVTPEGGDAFEVSVDDAGNWSFAAPDEVGSFAFSLYAKRGFDRSATGEFELTVLPAAPAFTSPGADSKTAGEVTSISGTGVAGATVQLTGDVETDVEVDDAGAWTVDTDLGPGAYEVTATQTVNGEKSGSATLSFSVVPTAPKIASPANGSSFTAAQAPASASGTGTPGEGVDQRPGGGLHGGHRQRLLDGLVRADVRLR